MAEEKNIKEYSATDFEKYWKGELSEKEMHLLEKAAMDDPFLSDALEGFRHVTNVSSDVELLKERLDRRTSAGTGKKRIGYIWLRAAAAIIIIAGLGFFTRQFLFNDRNSQVAVINKEKDSTASSLSESINNSQPTDSQITKLQTEEITTDKKTNSSSVSLSKEKLNPIEKTGGEKTDEISQGRVASSVTEPIKAETQKTIQPANNAIANQAAGQPNSVAANTDSVTILYGLADKEQKGFRKFSVPTNERAKIAVGMVSFTNKFNYRVVDAQNNPVPFANVYNTSDGVGTYTDIKGSFNLISSDSILNVRIKSLGYNSLSYKLTPDKNNNLIVLQEDEQARSNILANNRKVVSSVTRKDSAELEEPEVGWGYYNTYIANNINIPDDIRQKNPSPQVELSFDVDKNGQPINIEITKSSQCKECDEEAIRLLKEGPKWKRKGKRTKTTISMSMEK